MTKKINILIGDDNFIEAFTYQIFSNEYIPKLQNQVPSYTFNWKLEIKPETVIRNAQTGKYDIVITDLDYCGYGTGKEGYEVVDKISEMPSRPLLILCTSSNNIQEINERTKGKIDFRAGGCPGRHKFDDLINFLIEYYSDKQKTMQNNIQIDCKEVN